MKTNFLAGSLWMLGYAFMSVANDTLTKELAINMPPSQLVFLRFFIGGLSLIALILLQKRILKTKFFLMHSIRGLMLYFGMFFFTKSLQTLPLSTNIVGCFTIPIFVSIMATIFLKEKLKDGIWHTLLSFLGVIIAFYEYLNYSDPNIIFLMSAVSLFALLDILNKKLLTSDEPTIIIMFYTAMLSAAFSFPGAYTRWESLTFIPTLGAIALGIGGNVVFYCLLKSFASAPITFVQPFKYIELPLSFTVSVLYFHETLSKNMIFGSLIICITTLHSFYIGNKKSKEQQALDQTLSHE